MTIQGFIEKAKTGGWYPITPHVVEAMTGRGDPITSILLDPLAWKAVGKVERWKDDFFDAHVAKMHRMIDALAEGKTIEQYLETL